MELLYIYADEFEGLEQKLTNGIELNFGGEYTFKYKNEGCKAILKRDLNQSYIKNFFSITNSNNSISNITGIIGKNTAGKTRIIRLISEVLLLLKEIQGLVYEPEKCKDYKESCFEECKYRGVIERFSIKKFICVAKYEETFIAITNIRNLETELVDLKNVYKPNQLKDLKFPDTALLSNIFDFRNSLISKITYDFSINKYFNDTLNFDTPKQKIFSTDLMVMNLLSLLIKNADKINSGRKFLSIDNFMNKSFSINKVIIKLQENGENLYRDILWNIILRFSDNNIASSDYGCTNLNSNPQNLNDLKVLLGNMIININNKKRINRIIKRKNKIKKRINRIIKRKNESALGLHKESALDEIEKYIIRINKFLDDNKLDDYFIEKYYRYGRLEFNINDIDEAINFASKYNFATIFNSNLNIKYYTDKDEYLNFSSGEISMLYQYSNLIDLPKNNQYLLFIDEGEANLHPKWQLEYIYTFMVMLNSGLIAEGSKFQVIFTSNSPFLISDLPSNNVICVSEKEITKGIKSFASNTHELLKHAFFIDDKQSTIGAFADYNINKIKLALFYHELKENKESEDVIDIKLKAKIKEYNVINVDFEVDELLSEIKSVYKIQHIQKNINLIEEVYVKEALQIKLDMIKDKIEAENENDESKVLNNLKDKYNSLGSEMKIRFIEHILREV